MSFLRTVSPLVMSATLLVGCQGYRPAPLDASAVLHAWRERSPTSDSVKTFADSIARQSPTTRPAFDASDGLTLSEAELVALVFNPDLRRARLEANVARVGAAEAGRWDDPSISVDLQRVLSSSDDPWVVGGMVNLTIPLSGRLQLEKKLAGDEQRVAELRALATERSVINELRQSWSAWSAATSRARVLESAVAELQAIESATAKLRDAGELDPTEARLFAIDLVQRRAELLAAQRDAARYGAQLRQWMGISPQVPLRLVPGATPAPVGPTADPESHTDVAIARAEYAVAERSLELEVRKQYPDLQLGVGPGTDQGDTRILGGISIPLPLLNANRRGIAEALAKRDVARAEFETVLTRIESHRHLAQRDVDAARQSIELIERELVLLVDRQLLEARKLLDAGEFNPLLVREAIDAATSTKIQLIDARQSLDEAVIEQTALNESPFVASTPSSSLEKK
jgi:outer membrane protein, heavy metal efflux system